MRLGFFFCVLFSFLSLPFSYAKSPHNECSAGHTLRLVSSFTFDDGAKLQIHECGDANKISFYRVVLSNFNAYESIKLSKIETVMSGTLMMRADKNGSAAIDIIPEIKKRDHINLDFRFTRGRIHLSQEVSKFIPVPEYPAKDFPAAKKG